MRKISAFASAATLVALMGSVAAPASASANDKVEQKCSMTSKVTIIENGVEKGYDVNTGEILPAPRVDVSACSGDTSTNPGEVSTQGIPVYARHVVFTSARRSAAFVDSNGRFDGQVTWDPKAGYPIAWGYKVSAPLLAAANPGWPTVDVWRDGGGCYYRKNNVPLNYSFHGSCRQHAANREYALIGKIVFGLKNGSWAKIDWSIAYTMK